MLRALNKKEGFTLIELLIVVAIIGILAAIAIPQFAAYRERAYCSASESDLANLAITEEAFYTDQTPPAYADFSAISAAPPTGAGYKNSSDVTVTATPVPAAGGLPDAFTATAKHTNCNTGGDGAGTFNWNSANGGLNGL